MKKTILLFLTILIAVKADFKLEEINSESGYMIIKQNPIELISSFNKIIHIINLDSYVKIIDSIENSIKENYFFFHDQQLYKILLDSITNVRYKLDTVLPHHRQKRGLINLGGTTLKWLFGTMDNDERQNIETHLKIIDENNHRLVIENNKQISINTQLQEQFESLIQKINKHQTLIKEFINTTNLEQKRLAKNMQTLQINTDIMLVSNEIEKLQDNIVFSTIGILGRNILSSDEIRKFKITTKKLEHVKSSLARINNKLAFIISIPNFSKKEFTKIKIIPVPNSNKIEIDINMYEYIIKNNTVYNNNNNHIYVKELIKSNECIQQLYKNSYENCKFTINNIPEIIELEEGLILTKNIYITNLTNNYNNLEYKIKK